MIKLLSRQVLRTVAVTSKEVVSMKLTLKKGFAAHERLPSPHADVGFCNFDSCIADVYFHICGIITKKPSCYNFGEFTDDFLQ